MPSVLAILAVFSVSAFMSALKSWLLGETICAPRACRRSSTSLVCIAWVTRSCSLASTSGGVPERATKPYHSGVAT